MSDFGIPWLWADVPGHASYLLIAISYWLTSIFWLRVMAVFGLALEILYFRMSGGAMHTGIGWDVVFIAINLFQIYRLIAEHLRLRHMHELHLLSQGAFCRLSRKQLARLVTAGTWRTFDPGTQITREGEPVREMMLICDGQVVVEAQGQAIARLHGGSLVGELAFVSGNPASATVTVEQSTRALALDMDQLRKLVDSEDLVAAAIDSIVGRDLAAKLTEETKLRSARGDATGGAAAKGIGFS